MDPVNVNEDRYDKNVVHRTDCMYLPREKKEDAGRWHVNQTLEQLIQLLQGIRQRNSRPIKLCSTCNPVVPQQVQALLRN